MYSGRTHQLRNHWRRALLIWQEPLLRSSVSIWQTELARWIELSRLVVLETTLRTTLTLFLLFNSIKNSWVKWLHSKPLETMLLMKKQSRLLLRLLWMESIQRADSPSRSQPQQMTTRWTTMMNWRTWILPPRSKKTRVQSLQRFNQLQPFESLTMCWWSRVRHSSVPS